MPQSTSAANGSLGPYLYAPITSSNGANTHLNNNVWNAGSAPGWAQTLTATDPGNWSVVANITNNSGAVISYPDVEQDYNEQPLSSFQSITSSYTETMNATAGSLCEAAYDIWLNNYTDEIMIWVDTTTLQRNTLSFDTHLATVTLGGLVFDVYHPTSPGSTEWIYCLQTNMPSGTVDVLTVLRHAEANYIGQSTLRALEFGWEISTTNSLSQTFTMSYFSITENASYGHPGAARRR